MSAAPINVRCRVTLEEAKRILAECEDKYHHGTERFALANTIVSLYAMIDMYEKANRE